jgi:fatty-acyl-CoA synthase
MAMGHPKIAMAAVIAAIHPKWDERPVLIAIKKPDADLSEIEILGYYADKVAKWQIPDKVIFVESIPLSGTGKMLKKDLREQYGNVLLNS